MVNLLITMQCNRSCSYCFAKEKLHSYSRPDMAKEMSLENLDTALSFLEKSNHNVVQLAGGEPTMHSNFKDILSILISRKMKVNILSNALWNSSLNEFFSKISPLSLGFLLNIDNPKTYSISEWGIIEENLQFLKGRGNVTLSFNIKDKHPDYNYILDLVERFGFKFVRLSFSMPVNFSGKKNSYLSIPEYKEASKYVLDFVRKAEALGASVGMDNAVPICMFTAEQLSELMLKQVIEPSRNFVCYPAIDIGPDLSIWRCFGTSKLFNKKLSDFESLQEICEYYQQVSRLYQFKFYPMKECETCDYAKQEKCQGGCIGFAESKSEELGCQVSEITDEKLLASRPKLASGVALKKYELPQEISTINFSNGNLMEIPVSTASLISFLDGARTVKEAIALQLNGSDVSANSEIDELLIELSSQKTLPIIRRLLDRKVLEIN